MNIDQDKLDIELEKKQNTMLETKQGFFAPTEGDNGDTGICIHNGIRYFAVKVQDKWEFAQLGLKDESSINIDNSIKKVMKKFFRLFLTNNSSTINTIINNTAPRTFSIPFSMVTYTNGVGTVIYPSGFILPGGISDSTLISDILNERMGSASVGNVYIPTSFKCRLKAIRAIAYFTLNSGTDTNDARIAFASDIYNAALSGSTTPSISATAPSHVSSNHYYASWIISPSASDFEIAENAQIALTISVTNPSTCKFNTIGGNLFFEEVL